MGPVRRRLRYSTGARRRQPMTTMMQRTRRGLVGLVAVAALAVGVFGAGAPQQADAAGQAVLRIQTTAPGSVLNSGESGTYTATVTNIGTVASYNVEWWTNTNTY